MEIDDFTLCWLAGLLEGDGSFCEGLPSNPSAPIISLKMTDEDVIAKVASMFAVKYHAVEIESSRERNWRQPYHVKITGQKAVQWMQRLYPLMGERRRKQIDKALACYNGDGRKVLSPEQLEELKTRLQAGEHVLTLAAEFGVSKSYAYIVKSGQH